MTSIYKTVQENTNYTELNYLPPSFCIINYIMKSFIYINIKERGVTFGVESMSLKSEQKVHVMRTETDGTQGLLLYV